MISNVTPPKSKTAATDALVGIWTVVLTAFVIGVLYFARELLIPIALAALLTFLLSPLVSRIERWLGRVAAVLAIVALIFSLIGGGGWILTRQLLDLAIRLPDYQENVRTKLRSIRLPEGGAFTRLSQSIEDLKKELPAIPSASAEPATTSPQAAPRQPPPAERVTILDRANGGPAELVQMIAASVLGPLGTAALVLLLLVFMLLKREDLRGRLIRLIGEGRISSTTRAMDDAGARVSRYLLMQLVVNVTYGIPVAIGLYFIGVPNALLWGAFAAVLRFIPYVGPWIAAAFPIVLSLAVSNTWWTPLLTVGLFVILELLSNNVMEPWLYGSSTGVSPVALIVAAVFWTWLWGPVGLVLATPLTVCLAVMGRHAPHLRFLSVLLSEDEALAPHEEFYYRLIATNPDEANLLAETWLKTHSLTELYDVVVIPVLTTAEIDHRREALPDDQLAALHHDIRDIIDDLGNRPVVEPPSAASETPEEALAITATTVLCRVLCLPARADRDELAGAMLTQLLRQQTFEAENAGAKLVTGELLELVEKSEVEAVCVSVVAPTTVLHARYLCTKLRTRFPQLRIVVGIWGMHDALEEAGSRLRTAGADAIVTTLADAVPQFARFSSVLAAEPMTPAPTGPDEDARLAELLRLNLLDTDPEDAFDRVTRKLVRLFDVPIALITFVDRDRQFFKAQTGLPDDLAQARSTPRSSSICGHVVASNDVLVVEDLARDRRFANNPLLKERRLRFYAGVPLRSPGGQPVGSLCILDVKPRQMSERERNLLQIIGEEVTEQIAARALSSSLPSSRA